MAASDSAAISKLKIADNHRNYRTNFGHKESQKEALRLYEEIMNDKKVSVDVRARAKINCVVTAKVRTCSNYF